MYAKYIGKLDTTRNYRKAFVFIQVKHVQYSLSISPQLFLVGYE